MNFKPKNNLDLSTKNKYNTFHYLKQLFLFFLLFLSLACIKKEKSILSDQDLFLPTETQIKQVLSTQEDYTMLNDYAKAKGYKTAKELQAKYMQDISDEELQIYYKKYKPSGIETVGVEAVANERRKILIRIAWYKIIQEVNLNVEIRGLAFSKVDWKNIPLDEEPSIGNQFAKVTVIEFSDFECHFCSKSQDASKRLREKYGKKIYWVFKDFPLQEIHEDAFQAHISANCVNQVQPEKYWSHFNTLFQNYRNLEKGNLFSIAQESGINLDKWKFCMENPDLKKKITAEIQTDIKEGKKLGIKGTPTFIINGNLVVGARGYEFFDALIQKELSAQN